MMKPDERVHVDGAFLAEIVVQLGVLAAQDAINEALELMARDLAAIDDALADARLGDVVTLGDRVSRSAWELGLTTLSGVAVDLALCAERGDLTALAAVHARFARIGNRSLVAAWAEAAI